jgi:hypothetical protein
MVSSAPAAKQQHQPVGDIYLPPRVSKNVDLVYRGRTAMALVSGAVAGCAGLTGFWGLGAHAVACIVFDFLLYHVLAPAAASAVAAPATASGDSSADMAAPVDVESRRGVAVFLPLANRDGLTLGSVTAGMMTFVLAWMIAYNMIFIF